MRNGSGFSKYDRKEISQSIYCYKDTDVLINKEHIRDSKLLADYEADITLIRQYELEKEETVKGRFGMSHLKRIHKYIFQDVYPFAGKFRIENIEKGSTFFCKSEYIEENLKSIFSKLKKDDDLKGLGWEELSGKLAYYLSELNMIHPFREGNGRSIREFIRQLALNRGYIINWSLVEHDVLLEATIIAAKNEDLGPLTHCIAQVIENK